MFYQRHMQGIRKAIEDAALDEFSTEFYDAQAAGDPL
jgi:queuine/archaeosine tRNA-ribosyltransferase